MPETVGLCPLHHGEGPESGQEADDIVGAGGNQVEATPADFADYVAAQSLESRLDRIAGGAWSRSDHCLWQADNDTAWLAPHESQSLHIASPRIPQCIVECLVVGQRVHRSAMPTIEKKQACFRAEVGRCHRAVGNLEGNQRGGLGG